MFVLGIGVRPASAADSRDYPPRPGRVNGVLVPFTGMVGPGGRPVPIWGAVGVDLVLGSTGRPYLPCKHHDPARGDNDSFLDACAYQGSYATFSRFPAGRGLVFPSGYRLGNAQADRVHGGRLRTDWGRRAAGLSFEFYPRPDRDAEFVHSRFYVDSFTPAADGWAHSAKIGTIRLVTLADPGTTRLNGRLTDGRRIPAKGRVHFTVFGGAARSSAGYPISSFAVTKSSGGNYWTTGAMYAGPQTLTVDDTATRRSCTYHFGSMAGTNNRWDFDLSRPGFGHSGGRCTG